MLLAYGTGVYLVLPAVWGRYAYRHPLLHDDSGIATNGAGIPGDPLNVGLTGTKAEAVRIMLAAKKNGCADGETRSLDSQAQARQWGRWQRRRRRVGPRR
jgi:hypothetical protein